MQDHRTCSVRGCDRRCYGHGLCHMHYQRWKRHGTTADPIKPSPKTCSVEGCNKPHLARDWCSMHYMRMREHGSLEKAERVRPDRTKRTCQVDGCERPVWALDRCGMHDRRIRETGSAGPAMPLVAPRGSGCLRADGYRILTLQGHPLATATGQVLEHRVVLYEAIGPGGHPCHWCQRMVFWEKPFPEHPDGLVVDHLDFDRSNNTVANLFPSCGPCNLRRGSGATG